MIDYSTLKNEITNDPIALGYGPFVESGSDQAIADLLNETTGAGVGQVSVPFLPKNAFLAAILPVTLVLPTLSPEIQQKWDRVLGIVRAADGVDLTGGGVQGLLGLAVADGVLTSAQAAAIGKRIGSRAEVLFGAGTIITNNDVSFALRGVR